MIINIRIGLFFPPEQSFTNFSKIINIYNLEKKKRYLVHHLLIKINVST